MNVGQATNWSDFAGNEAATHRQVGPIIMDRLNVMIGALEKLKATPCAGKLQCANDFATERTGKCQ